MVLRSWIENRHLTLVCRLILGAVFVYASFDKILHPAAFAKTVYNYQLLPMVASNVVAVTLPWVELLVGLALVVGVFRAQSALVVSALLAVFILAISINLARGVDIDCGCFRAGGDGGRRLSVITLVQDGLLLTAGMIVLSAARRDTRSVDR